MEPLTAGTLMLAFVGSKLIDWSIGKAFDAAYDTAKQVLAKKSPETAEALAAAAEQASLPAAERKNIGVAVLVDKVEKVAQADPEIKDAVEALGNQAYASAQDNPALAKAIQELTQTIKAQKPPSQNPAKIAETIGINEQNISGGEVVQHFGSGNIQI
ncbi:hypothetical protein [Nostoc sp. LEGE 12450]|uniref:hypothetical protein n=1 Tax=Nostoc sp. LEGE 12450 TaxID=1828643 RepID=UPI0018811FB4|nr:hypothetical protein [Nostoc sp. LEGE 12450]MBE8989201.1 hypothetical protein [Nostoc sp. LEGE 12450]